MYKFELIPETNYRSFKWLRASLIDGGVYDKSDASQPYTGENSVFRLAACSDYEVAEFYVDDKKIAQVFIEDRDSIDFKFTLSRGRHNVYIVCDGIQSGIIPVNVYWWAFLFKCYLDSFFKEAWQYISKFVSGAFLAEFDASTENIPLDTSVSESELGGIWGGYMHCPIVSNSIFPYRGVLHRTMNAYYLMPSVTSQENVTFTEKPSPFNLAGKMYQGSANRLFRLGRYLKVYIHTPGTNVVDWDDAWVWIPGLRIWGLLKGSPPGGNGEGGYIITPPSCYPVRYLWYVDGEKDSDGYLVLKSMQYDQCDYHYDLDNAVFICVIEFDAPDGVISQIYGCNRLGIASYESLYPNACWGDARLFTSKMKRRFMYYSSPVLAVEMERIGKLFSRVKPEGSLQFMFQEQREHISVAGPCPDYTQSSYVYISKGGNYG